MALVINRALTAVVFFRVRIPIPWHTAHQTCRNPCFLSLQEQTTILECFFSHKSPELLPQWWTCLPALRHKLTWNPHSQGGHHFFVPTTLEIETSLVPHDVGQELCSNFVRFPESRRPCNSAHEAIRSFKNSWKEASISWSVRCNKRAFSSYDSSRSSLSAVHFSSDWVWAVLYKWLHWSEPSQFTGSPLHSTLARCRLPRALSDPATLPPALVLRTLKPHCQN